MMIEGLSTQNIHNNKIKKKYRASSYYGVVYILCQKVVPVCEWLPGRRVWVGE